MDRSFDIRQLESLKDLKHAFLRFGNEVNQSLDVTKRFFRRIRAELQRRRMAEQRNLERALRLTRYGDTTAILEIGRIQKRLTAIGKCLSQVEKEMATYQKMATRMKKLVSHHMVKANLMLQNKIIEVEKYVAVSLGSKEILSPSTTFQAET